MKSRDLEPTTMISVSKLSKQYGNQVVLKDVDLEFAKGQSVALIGPNGSGKTTLIKSILGLVVPDEGKIEVQGANIRTSPNYRRDIGYMPQLSRFPEQMQVRQLFSLIDDLRKGEDGIEKDLSLYEDFQIDRIARKALGALSGGMKQQVSAALAFYYNPEIIILDEPTAGLDPVSNEILKAKINRQISLGRLVVVTSHILSDLDEICNHVVYLMEGKIYMNASIDQIASETGEQKLNKMIVKLIENKNSDE